MGTQTTHQLTITDDDIAGVTVTETGGSTDVVEGGATDDFTIVLTSQPTAGTVTVQAVPDAQCEINGNGAGNPATFTFTSGNWNMSQTFTVAAIDDLVAEGPHTCTITNSISASGAPEYPTTLPVSAVTANITDNDAAGITVSPTSGLTVSEENITPATFTLTSSGEPTADVTVPVNGDANCEVSTDGVTYSASVNIVLPAGAAMPQTVYVQAVNDGVVDGDVACTITTGDPASTDAQYDALGAGDVDDVTATALDNDLDFALATAGGGVEGTGGTQTYTFTITPGGAIAHVGGTVDFAIGGTGVNGTDYNFVPAADISGSGVTVAGSTVTFAQNAGAATLTFNIITDSITEADFTIEVTLSNPTAGTAGTGSVSSSPLALTVTDDDVAGVAITQSGGATAVVEGDAAGDTYTVVLNTIPGSAVTITITPQAGCDLGAGDGVAITLIFNADAAALTPQTVTVTAPDNATADGNRACDLTHTAASADTNYNGAGVAFTVDAAPTNIVTVNITDDDTPAVLIDLVDGSVDTTEGGITDDYTVVLATVPTDQVTVTLTPDAQCDLGGGAGVAVNLTFEVATALDAQIVTVTAVDDVLTEGPHTCVITHASSSTDSAYNPASITVDGVTTNIVTVNITDNDVPGLTFSRVRVTEGGASRTYTIQLNTMPTADVEITAITPDAQCTISGVTLPLVFTTADWNTPQAVTVTAVDDNDDEGNHTCNVTHTISSADAVYGALGAEAHTVNVRDNDRDDPTVTPPPSTGGGDKPPTAQVDIGVFDPAISKIGFLLPGQVGVGGEQLEWVVTVSNNGSAPGTNIQVTDQIDSRLRINRVETPPQATAVVQRQTVTVTIPLLAPGEVVIFSIFTTVLQGASVENTACLTADDIAAQRCTTSVAVAGLPATGETPWWRTLLLVLLPGILAGGAAVSLVRRQRLNNRSG